MLIGQRPERCEFYITSPDGKGEMTVWAPPTGEQLCRGFFGCSERQFALDILDGKFDHIMHPAAVSVGGV